MKNITTLVSALAIIGGSLIAHSVKASDQKYYGEFDIPVVGEIKKGSQLTVFTWPNKAGDEQDFFRIKSRVENEERSGDIKVRAVLGKNNSWHLDIGMTGGQEMRKQGESVAFGRILIGEEGAWNSEIKSFDAEVFWQRQVINGNTLPTLLKFDFSGITWEQDKVEEKTTTSSSSGKGIDEDPNEVDLSKLKIKTSKKSSSDE